MKFTALINSLTLSLATIILLAINHVAALPSSNLNINLDETSDLPKGYTLSPLLITGSIIGIPVNHTGTIEEVFSQLKAEHPEHLELHSALRAASTPSFERLDKRFMTDVNCIPVLGQNWARANYYTIGQGIDYLRKKGNLICRLNGRSCTRVSCSYDAAIIVCNNNDYRINPTCGAIADFAQALRDRCIDKNLIHGVTCGGQAWDNGNWNVNVYKNQC